MCNQKHTDAAMRDYAGPFFPAGIEKIQAAFYGNGADPFTRQTLEYLGSKALTFVGLRKAQTSDNYRWYWVMPFQLDTGAVLIAFPWAMDRARSDGTLSDRHMAVYTSGTCPDEKIAEILAVLREARTTVEHDMREA